MFTAPILVRGSAFFVLDGACTGEARIVYQVAILRNGPAQDRTGRLRLIVTIIAAAPRDCATLADRGPIYLMSPIIKLSGADLRACFDPTARDAAGDC